jgi:low affinity Fe/Cu permease
LEQRQLESAHCFSSYFAHNPGANVMQDLFRKFSFKVSKLAGSPWMFVSALVVIMAWAITGPLFHFSDTWQLVINTGTTIITFLMVFLIQNTQNRDAEAIQLKLDELIRAVTEARTSLVDLEELSDDELERLHEEFRRLRERENHKFSSSTTALTDLHGAPPFGAAAKS